MTGVQELHRQAAVTETDNERETEKLNFGGNISKNQRTSSLASPCAGTAHDGGSTIGAGAGASRILVMEGFCEAIHAKPL